MKLLLLGLCLVANLGIATMDEDPPSYKYFKCSECYYAEGDKLWSYTIFYKGKVYWKPAFQTEGICLKERDDDRHCWGK